MLSGGTVSWQSKRQQTVALSTVEAEYVAFNYAAKQACKLQLLLHEMVGRKGPVNIYCDSTGCIANLKNCMISEHTKHIAIKYHAGRESVTNQQIVPEYISTDENVADIFTKPLDNAKFSKFRDGMGMT
jgi:ATP sulfurylase